MSWSRRNFLITAGLSSAVTTLMQLKGCSAESITVSQLGANAAEWQSVRAEFSLDPRYIHMAGLLLTSHPAPVQGAIAQYRQALDENPALYVEENNATLEAQARQSAADYLGVTPSEVALTYSTTMGTALVINGLRIRPDQEMLTTEFDYYSTHESLRYKANRTGASVRKIPLYRDIQTVTEDEMVETLINTIRPETRLVTATWVHSSTGLKVPVRRIGDRLRAVSLHSFTCLGRDGNAAW